MAYKYLYIDDTKNAIEQGTINALQDGGEIEITFKKPNDWEIQILDLIKDLPNFNGIILDLRLNDTAYEENKFAQYRGSTVAQELRTLSKENKFEKDFPIILISANDNLHKSLDVTSLDLFDFCVSKNELEQLNGLSYHSFRNELKWLADGYEYLNTIERNVCKILNISSSDFIDIRFIDDFKSLLDKPVHVIARFLTKQVIKKPSFLINESYLAARMGIDISASGDWLSLLDKLKDCQYTGAFSNYHKRWWMNGIENYWIENISQEFSLRNISAKKRVELLIESTGFAKLVAMPKQSKSKSESFWVICKASGVAIDTIDGFTIAGHDDNYPWQEPVYISIDEALRPTRPNLWKSISSMEKPRLQNLKTFFESDGKRKQ